MVLGLSTRTRTRTRLVRRDRLVIPTPGGRRWVTRSDDEHRPRTKTLLVSL